MTTPTPPTTLFLSAKNYNAETTELTISQPTVETHGKRYSITSEGKQVVVAFPECLVRPCLDSKGRPFLVVDEPTELLMSVLDSVRQRCAVACDMKVEAVRPLMSEGRSLLHTGKQTMFLNINKNAKLQDLTNKVVGYQSVRGQRCFMVLFIHLQGFFVPTDTTQQPSLQLRVSQMALTKPPQPIGATEKVVEVDTVDDIASLL
jgi:hypothetical protein